MKQPSSKNKKLFEIAESQQGLFTAKQAEEAGFINKNHVYHVKVGHWTRVERGIYRLNLFPYTSKQQLVTYALWSRNRNGEVEGVYSHETALNHYELSDINPSKLHMTVPKTFRRNSKTPKVLEVHFGDISKQEIKKGRGYLITTPLRTLQDVIEIQNISFEFIEQALKQAVERGLIRRAELTNLAAKIDKKNVWKNDLNTVLKEIA